MNDREETKVADETTSCVSREDFIALCEQVVLVAAELEQRDRRENPDGPNGWRLRKATVIKERLVEILEKQKPATERQAPRRLRA